MKKSLIISTLATLAIVMSPIAHGQGAGVSATSVSSISSTLAGMNGAAALNASIQSGLVANSARVIQVKNLINSLGATANAIKSGQDSIGGLSKAQRAEIASLMLEALSVTDSADASLTKFMSGNVAKAIDAIAGNSDVESVAALDNVKKILENYITNRKSMNVAQAFDKATKDTVQVSASEVGKACSPTTRK